MQNLKWNKTKLKNYSKDQIHQQSDSVTRATFIPIIKLHRFIHPFKFYRITPSLVLAHENRSIYLNFDILLASKCVNSVECNHSYRNMITVTMTDNVYVGIKAKDYLVARLKSFGDAELYEWALMIQNYEEDYLSQYTSFLTNLRQNQLTFNQQELIEENKERICQELMDKPCVWVYKVCSDMGVLHTSVCFTAKFLQLLGYTKQKFIKVLSEEGFPKFMSIPCNKASEYARYMFNNMFLMKWSRHSSKQDCKLLSVNGNVLYTKQELEIIVDQECSRNTILSQYVLLFDPIPQQEEQDINSPMLLEYVESIEYQKMVNAKLKQIEVFNEKFYPALDSKEEEDKKIREEKVCKVKEVSETQFQA